MEPDACDVDTDVHVPDPNFSLKGIQALLVILGLL
jgi:hypothetical protein